MLMPGNVYSAREVWSIIKPNQTYPDNRAWFSNFIVERQNLHIFIDLDEASGNNISISPALDSVVLWHGKPNAHSAQPTFAKLFRGLLIPKVFVRWDRDDERFLFLGVPLIEKFKDNFQLASGAKTIQVSFSFSSTPFERDMPPPDGLPLGRLEGAQVTVLANRYERDPRLRLACIKAHGSICKVCNFDFHAVYGDLGQGYIQVHHLTPLSEYAGEKLVDPVGDLVPVCANCHAMLHARTPILTPQELKTQITISNYGQYGKK